MSIKRQTVILIVLVGILAILTVRLLYRGVVVTDAFLIRETGLVHVTYPMKYRELYGEYLAGRGWAPVSREDFPYGPMSTVVFAGEKVSVTFPAMAHCFGDGRDGLKDFGRAGYGSATIGELADVVVAIEKVLMERVKQCPILKPPKGLVST